ncbi:hypothetical protein L3Y34_015274 [Caenorhabditis briggsae]|uniref:Uncharacterized protein n=2 Tax=Caenorhabditis briggsae TaxID=6238 RepID=A0AAE9DT76_CAEBR|nr:hypothetical protein L3Y34_015274 [Caenorhabditis briggsae]
MKVVPIFLILTSLICQSHSMLESYFPLTVLPLKFDENPKDHQRIYYSEKSVLRMFSSSGYISSNSSFPSIFGLASPDTDCEVIDTLCPQLTQVFHVSVNGSPRLVSWSDLKDNETAEIIEEAGYVGSWPGYCGTTDGALVEMFSPILKQFRYASSNEDILKARWNEDRQFWRPTKIIGYLFNATVPHRTIHYPFNAIKPYENVVFNKILLRLRPIIRVKNSAGLVAFTTSFRDNGYLKQYKFDKVYNISLIDQTTNVAVISDACGKMTLIYEFFNPITTTYRLKLRDDDPNEEMVKRAGYVFREESSARRCLGDIQPIYEFQNPEKQSDIHYSSSPEEVAEYTNTKKWTNLGLMGFTSWGNFAFAKR